MDPTQQGLLVLGTRVLGNPVSSTLTKGRAFDSARPDDESALSLGEGSTVGEDLTPGEAGHCSSPVASVSFVRCRVHHAVSPELRGREGWGPVPSGPRCPQPGPRSRGGYENGRG